MKTGLNF